MKQRMIVSERLQLLEIPSRHQAGQLVAEAKKRAKDQLSHVAHQSIRVMDHISVTANDLQVQVIESINQTPRPAATLTAYVFFFFF